MYLALHKLVALNNKAVSQVRIHKYMRSGRKPWSLGYFEYRARFVNDVLSNAKLLTAFKHNEPLPYNYGIGLDERCVEYPWAISRLDSKPTCCLDAGSALNHAYVLDHRIFNNKQLYILTLSPEPQCFWRRGISYLYEDLRHISMRDHFYDTIISISTLEHVGFDNSLFTTDGAHQLETSDGDFKIAVRELWRVLKPGGQLLITVPFGVFTNFGTFQQFDLALLHSLESSVEAVSTERTFYMYTKQGWELSDAEQCASREYFPWCMLPQDQRLKQMPSSPDGAAAARAVACLKLVK